MTENYPPNSPYSPNPYAPQQNPDPYAAQQNPAPYGSPPSYPPIPVAPPSYPPIPAQSDSSPAMIPAAYPSAPYSGLMTPEPPRRSRARLFLIVAAVLAFAVAGTFAGLYVVADGDHEKAVTTLEDKKSELADVKQQNTTATGERDQAEQRNGDLETANGGLKPCVDATQHYLWDGTEGTEREAALDAMFAACG
jgi:hypothetical protein